MRRLGDLVPSGFKRNYWVIVVTWVLVVFGSRISFTYMSNYVYILGGSESLVGYVLGVAAIPTAIVRIVGGAYSDVRGRKRIIVWCTWVLALTNYLIALAPDWRILLIALTLNNIALIYTPALHATLAESMPSGRRTIGFLYANIIPELLSIPAPLIGGLITSAYGVENVIGYRIVFMVNAILLTAVAIIRHILLEETITPSRSPLGASKGLVWIRSLLLVAPPWLKKLLALNYVALSIPAMIYVYYGIRYIIYCGYDNTIYGVIVSVGSGFSLAATLAMTIKRVTVGSSRILGFIAVALGVGLLVFSTGTLASILAGGVIVQACIILRSAIANAMLHEYISNRLRARFTSLALASIDISSLAAGLIAGTIYPISPPLTLALASAASIAIGVAMAAKPFGPIGLEHPKGRS